MTWASQEQTHEAGANHLDAEMVELWALLDVQGNVSSESDEAGRGAAFAELGEAADADAAHLSCCPDCLARVNARASELRASRAAVEQLVDESFTDAALAQQREHILARLAGSRVGRVLAFPARDARPSRRDRPALRWLAAAAAAGLFVGVAAGQRLNPILSSQIFGPGHEAANRFTARATTMRPEASAQGIPVHVHDETFLSEMETALNYRGVAELRALDDLTPRVTPVVSRSPR